MPQPVATAPQTAAPVVRTIHRVPVKNVPVAIAEAVRSSVQRGGGVVVMTLNPDSLGALDIAIRVRGNQARISIRTEMSETKALLEHTMPLLMERLSAAGVKAEPVDVAMRARNAEDVAAGPSADRDRGGHSADDHKQHREQMAALRRAAVGGAPRKEYSTFA
jgi:flagellar hook-length control protein FliK